MSKIKVNEIESSSTNVKLAAKGTGVVKVKGAGGSDGTLKLNSGTHSVKIKSPAHSAGQSYTMILPDNNIETGKFLKVKSVTGSGNNATGQLEYATITEPDRANLNASGVTSGTIPSARFTPIPATVSALELVSVSTVGSTDVAKIDITGFLPQTRYLLIAKRLIGASPTQNYFRFKAYYNSSGYDQALLQAGVAQYSPTSTSTHTHVGARYTYQSEILLRTASSGYVWNKTMGFMCEINNSQVPSFFIRNIWCGNSNLSSGPYNFQEYYGGAQYDYNGSISKIELKPYQSYQNFTQGTTVLLYKYNA